MFLLVFLELFVLFMSFWFLNILITVMMFQCFSWFCFTSTECGFYTDV